VDGPAARGRATLDDPAVRRLVAAIAPAATVTDLGGVMSLNVRLEPARLVVRVHRPFVSRRRLLAVQEVRRRLAEAGLRVPTPLRWRGATVVRCGDRWAELEAYAPHERLEPSPDAFAWLFAALGVLHRALAAHALTVPRPLVAIYAPPATLRRWLPATEAAVAGDPEAADAARLLRGLVGRLRARWTPAAALPVHLAHGDVHLANVGRTPAGEAVYLDFGFLARRPRVHDLAYALSWAIVALGGHRAPERFAWGSVPRLIGAYEVAAAAALTDAERRALVPYTAAARLYHAAIAGFASDPAGQLRAERPFLRLSEWLLAHPEAMQR
jgi:Ser/Thr protein kinase RdoA (MazF antagonist)